MSHRRPLPRPVIQARQMADEALDINANDV